MNNLDALMDWCQKHNDECEEIAENGKYFMSQFVNLDRELELSREVLKAWFKIHNLPWGAS